MSVSDEPLTEFSLACGPYYSTLQALYQREVTKGALAEERGISVQTIGSQLRALEDAGLVRVAATSGRAFAYTLTDHGRDVLDVISGRLSLDRELAWVVGVDVGGASPKEVAEELDSAGGETFACAGDIDFISLFPRDAHDLTLALVGRLRDRGAHPVRTIVLP